LADANRAFKVLGEAVTSVKTVCAQIDNFTPLATWQASFEELLTPVRDNECFTAALRASVNTTFKSKDGDLKELTAREVKQLLHQLERAHKVMSLSASFLSVKQLCAEIEEFGEDQEEEMKNKVFEDLGALMQREQVLTALREVAPAAYVARAAGGLRELSVVQVKALCDALERQRSSDAMTAAFSPTALVRAIKELYCAESLDDATLSLEAESADGWALRELADRQEELAPALAALREKAIDCELLSKFVDQSLLLGEADTGPDAEMEADDTALPARPDGESVPVTLEDGWKLEWVSQIRGNKRDQYRFVDPVGRKYYSVFELRTAQEGGIEAVQEARKAKQQARQAEVGDRPAVVRTHKNRPSGGGGARKRARW